MKTLRLFTAAALLCTLPSCSLIGSILKLPASLMRSIGRTAGVSSLTDEAPSPVVESPAIPAPDSGEVDASEASTTEE
ncbi:hypothetical protein HW115_18020 [Verrucomicrobiaceae bacterium N1E253]|uniref:Uncharacterized protein n=1 Tax=Oceaniferula marina TaxID=2748318 RepID=A0A851GRW9_9BACT|nr:hypothetical protein [Oceaniferula marina]NWK57520.1 hypothetical protein [Oceaniferula marina]